MDESAIVSNQKILEIIEKPLAERDVNLYIEKLLVRLHKYCSAMVY